MGALVIPGPLRCDVTPDGDVLVGAFGRYPVPGDDPVDLSDPVTWACWVDAMVAEHEAAVRYVRELRDAIDAARNAPGQLDLPFYMGG